MGPLAQISTLVIQTLASLFLFIIVIRFLLQLVRADFYNPISQGVVKATNPVLIPLRRIIPGLFGIDLAAIVLAILVSVVAVELNALAIGFGMINPATVLVWSIIGLISLISTIFFWGLIIMIISSFIAPMSNHPALSLLRQLLEPIMAPFRKLIPPMGGFDLSPILVFLVINVVNVLIHHFAALAGLSNSAAQLVPGI
ncbi:YggT family protein [Marinibactrum halimedae]|uniref:YggT family protein n=1 Tax=Marinibactrum halimedae TaxID=1444977 RepID=A0AA37TAW8_9GAMM|nr:YggT family protein [Marinibactrum halimedae]MCD9458316.1 YggT family protein [Marinibactrum halimedae]GLS27056.1 hypothetical protein GCM10007877_27750 [Marinibactrum halimedae]